MIRLFVNSDLAENVSVCATSKQVHYLYHVMRQRVGDTVLLFNGRDGEWQASIKELSKKNGVFVPFVQTREQVEENGAILAVSLIKKDCFDLVLQKATELGVKKIIPLITARTVVHQLGMERAELIVTEASEQCERLTLPIVEKPMQLKSFLNTYVHECSLVYLSERGQTNLSKLSSDALCFMIGPEGGWAPEEIKLFEACQIPALNLGRLILRAETAAIGILAAHRFGNFALK